MNAVALQKATVLVVDDEFLVAEGLCMQVEDMNLAVCGTATNAGEALALAMMFRPEVVLMDMRLRGEQDGVDAALAIHAEVGSKVIFITGSREQSTIDRIHQDHPAGLLFKPASDRQLRMAIATALED